MTMGSDASRRLSTGRAVTSGRKRVEVRMKAMHQKEQGDD
jgi:hypothetical protein